ncbi:MAG: hypothetical protein OHK0023_13690 [Anaerolineae bacterium]
MRDNAWDFGDDYEVNDGYFRCRLWILYGIVTWVSHAYHALVWTRFRKRYALPTLLLSINEVYDAAGDRSRHVKCQSDGDR